MAQMFSALNAKFGARSEMPEVYTVTVGRKPSGAAAYLGDHNEVRARAEIEPRSYLGHISATSRPYLAHISALSRPYLGHISVISRSYLAGGRAAQDARYTLPVQT